MSNGPSKSARVKIWKRDKGECFYCSKGIALNSKDFTVDHVIPRCKDGPGHTWNLVTCCRKCNAEKDDKYPSAELLAVIDRRKLLSNTCIMLGKAYSIIKETGDVNTAEYFLAMQKITLNILYGTSTKEYRLGSVSESFDEVLDSVWTRFQSTVDGLENVSGVQAKVAKEIAVEKLLGV